MYIAAEDFKSYTQGIKKKGDSVEFNQLWLDNGLIAESKPKQDSKKETKPELKKKTETK